MSKSKRRRHFSWSLAALILVSTAGTVLTFTVTSTQAQNAVGIVSCTALAAIILHRLHQASDVVDAALQLAGEMARLGPDQPDRPPGLRSEADVPVAPVVLLPGPRAVADGRAEVS